MPNGMEENASLVNDMLIIGEFATIPEPGDLRLESLAPAKLRCDNECNDVAAESYRPPVIFFSWKQ